MLRAYNCWIGIDPGLNGAIAFILETDGKPKIIVKRLPIAGKELDIQRLAQWLRKVLAERQAIACIEKVGSMPDQGIASTALFMYCTGALHGLLAGMDIPRIKVAPTAWKKEILSGTAKDKEAAIDFCRAYYPTISIMASARAKKPDSNMADALCIARYCWIKHHDF